MSKLGRRGFITKGITAVSAIAAAKIVGSSSEALAASTAVDPQSPQAQALGYIHDATKVDLVKFPKKAGEEGKKQVCSNCIFYSNGGQKVAGVDGEWGGCALFTGNLVNAKGWCNSWAPKPQ
jgi:hypothetical protein